MILRPRNQSVVILALLLLVFIWYNRIAFKSRLLFAPEHGGSQEVARERKEFILKAMEVEFGEELDPQPIRELCEAKEWREGVIFSCDHIHGGIGNVRNHLLNCVRYAIEGGGALVVPSITERNASDIYDIYTQDREGLDYLLDRSAFVSRLSDACPQLTLYDRPDAFPNFSNLQATMSLLPGSFDPTHPRTGLREPQKWRESFDKWLVNQTAPEAAAPVHVKLGRAYLEYPVNSDGKPFAQNFGKILSFPQDVRYLAAAALWELKYRFGLPVQPDRLISPDTFQGAHLRVEKDAVQAWPGKDWQYQRYEVQSEQQINYIKAGNLSILYIATGDADQAARFAGEAIRAVSSDPESPRNLTAVTKHDLIIGSDRELLDKLTFDQHGLVDFLILLRSGRFAGIGHSSFAWNIALRRHTLSVEKTVHIAGSRRLLEDEYSAILGYEDQVQWMMEYEHCMWP
jgi:hypothetical protein